jgi:hypothetical protein
VQDESGQNVDPLVKRPGFDIERIVVEERVVQRRLGRRARAIDDGDLLCGGVKHLMTLPSRTE